MFTYIAIKMLLPNINIVVVITFSAILHSSRINTINVDNNKLGLSYWPHCPSIMPQNVTHVSLLSFFFLLQML